MLGSHAHIEQLVRTVNMFISASKLVLETFPIQQDVRNGHIYMKLVKQHILQDAHVSRKSQRGAVFHEFLKKGSTLRQILLYNSNINMTTAVILVY